MSKTATKASDNYFYKARMAASKFNEKLCSISALNKAETIKQDFLIIVADGKVTEDERPKLNRILSMLTEISQSVGELKIYCSKHFICGGEVNV